MPVINVPGGGNFRNFRRPDYTGADPFLHASDGRFYLNPAAFAIPAPGTVGNLGRNAIHGPGLAQFDLTLQKHFVITERTKIEFRAEIYNLFNHPNWNGANADPTSGSFGLVTGKGGNRVLQIALKYIF